eukprot:3597769-Karenia_brevis.AAC.1
MPDPKIIIVIIAVTRRKHPVRQSQSLRSASSSSWLSLEVNTPLGKPMFYSKWIDINSMDESA